MTFAQSAIDACKGAEAVVIATEWDEFKNLDWTEVYKNMSRPAFVFESVSYRAAHGSANAP